MTTMRAAVALLTRVPAFVPGSDASGAAAFAVVGGLVGAVGGLMLLLLGTGEPVLAGIAAIGAMAVCSGGLHLDGLADTADALAARGAGAAERARTDPSVGPTGVVALVLVLGAQAAALASLAAGPSGAQIAAATCVIAAVVSRSVPVVAARLARHRATPDGFGAWFIQRVTTADVGLAIGSAALIVAAVVAMTGALSAVPGAEFALLAAAIAGAALGGLTMAATVVLRGRLDGDAFGAGIEVTMTACLAAMAFLV